MMMKSLEENPSYVSYNIHNFHKIPQIRLLNEDQQEAISIVARVLPFKVNQYVLDELINWNNIPYDPIFQLTFPQREMLFEDDYLNVKQALNNNDSKSLDDIVKSIRSKLNPHPADQSTLNVPNWKGEYLSGLQYKYKKTLLYFPIQAQTCHAYCTFCFRWPQFIEDKSFRMASKSIDQMLAYLREHKQI